ncbi:MAG: hypothetical protein OXR73_20625 [Myxococcales bacterium]|nr:hypothetical protein [Myxococcales bacterium]
MQKGRLAATLLGAGQKSIDPRGEFRLGGHTRAMATKLLAIAAHLTAGGAIWAVIATAGYTEGGHRQTEQPDLVTLRLAASLSDRSTSKDIPPGRTMIANVG